MKVHFEPYLFLAGLTHKSALIAWGGFYFKVARTDGPWKLIDDSDLDSIHPPRSASIGARSYPYGQAHVEVRDEAGNLVGTGDTRTANHVFVPNLEPDRVYTYRVFVDGREWAAGPRRDWQAGEGQGMVESGREYVNRFRTHPRPDTAADLTFAAIGDFGTGVRRVSTAGRRQREVAAALAAAVDREDVRLLLTTGDNIYAGRTLLGVPLGATGDEDDDWFFTFYQPYRYVVNRIPVYPCIGNHDGNETEVNDDRDQIMDNFFLAERLQGEEAAGRACSTGSATGRRSSWSHSTRRGVSCSSASASSGTSTTSRSCRPPFPTAGEPTLPSGASRSRTTRPTVRARSTGTRDRASSTWCRCTGGPACGSC